ncbi:MAG: hypothetical protein A3E85_05490 [Gammaproteobacteria bacterium RIFCSPHIGHO2_12_FULL_45_12]|nr:MAG: hypothetical protein A3E85_05490 [Gammaproteobacteria bacterium RIFCSPHIGHO2_12_FULL_45_12]
MGVNLPHALTHINRAHALKLQPFTGASVHEMEMGSGLWKWGQACTIAHPHLPSQTLLMPPAIPAKKRGNGCALSPPGCHTHAT